MLYPLSYGRAAPQGRRRRYRPRARRPKPWCRDPRHARGRIARMATAGATTGRLGTGGGRWGMRADVLRHGDGHDSSRVGYVELFFDLVFVFAVTQLSHSLIAHPDLTTLLHTVVLGWAVWWLWIDTTWVTNWLDPDKVPVRAMLLVLMLLGLLMSSAIPEAFESKALVFAVPFVAIQLGRTLFTLWAMGRHWPENAVNFVRIAVWLGVSGAFWIGGALTHDEQTRLVLWVVA